MNEEYYGLSSGQLERLFQAQSVLSLLGKLSADVVNNARIHVDEMAAAAGFASECMQGVLSALGSATQPMFYVKAKEGQTHAC